MTRADALFNLQFKRQNLNLSLCSIESFSCRKHLSGFCCTEQSWLVNHKPAKLFGGIHSDCKQILVTRINIGIKNGNFLLNDFNI